MFNSEPNQNKKRKVVKVILNEKFIEAFDELTKNDAANIQSYQERRNLMIRNQQDALDNQKEKQQEIVDADSKKPASTDYERLWASHPPGTQMQRKGSGNYERDALRSKTGNYSVSRHLKQEAKRLKHMGRQYMGVNNYIIQPAKKVRLFITFNVMLFYLKNF